MRLLARMSVPVCLLSLALAGPVAVAAAHSRSGHNHGNRFGHNYGYSPTTGYVYLDDNTAPVNGVAAFARNPDGSLTALKGSPYSAGGAGSGAGNASQGSIQLADGGRYVLAVDNGSNQISVLAVQHGGGLALVGSPVGSGGVHPVSIAVHGDLVYVANAPSGSGGNYTGFRLTAQGKLVPIPASTYPASTVLPNSGQPDDVLFNPTGANLIGVEVGTTPTNSVIDSFALTSSGTLDPAAGSPFAAQGAGAFGSVFSPNNPDQLFVSNAHNGTALGTVSAFDVAADGTLTSIGSSPFADEQTAPCWLAITPDGRYVFAVNTAVPSVSTFAVAAGGSLTLVGSFPFKTGTGLSPTDAAVTPDGNYLYVDGSGKGVVSAFRILRGGFLSELGSSPTQLPAGATASGIAVS